MLKRQMFAVGDLPQYFLISRGIPPHGKARVCFMRFVSDNAVIYVKSVNCNDVIKYLNHTVIRSKKLSAGKVSHFKFPPKIYVDTVLLLLSYIGIACLLGGPV